MVEVFCHNFHWMSVQFLWCEVTWFLLRLETHVCSKKGQRLYCSFFFFLLFLNQFHLRRYSNRFTENGHSVCSRFQKGWRRTPGTFACDSVKPTFNAVASSKSLHWIYWISDNASCVKYLKWPRVSTLWLLMGSFLIIGWTPSGNKYPIPQLCSSTWSGDKRKSDVPVYY